MNNQKMLKFNIDPHYLKVIIYVILSIELNLLMLDNLFSLIANLAVAIISSATTTQFVLIYLSIAFLILAGFLIGIDYYLLKSIKSFVPSLKASGSVSNSKSIIKNKFFLICTCILNVLFVFILIIKYIYYGVYSSRHTGLLPSERVEKETFIDESDDFYDNFYNDDFENLSLPLISIVIDFALPIASFTIMFINHYLVDIRE